MSVIGVTDVATEKIVIGTLLSYGNLYHTLSEYLSEDCFTEPRLRSLYRVIGKVVDSGTTVDILSVSAKIKTLKTKLTSEDVVEVSNNVCLGDIMTHVMRLKELEIRRRLRLIGIQLTAAGENLLEDIDDILNKIKEELAGIYRDKTDGIVSLRETVTHLKKVIDDNQSGETVNGTKTGFSLIDKGGGLHGTDLIIIAGATSQGKTSLALSMMLNACSDGAKVAFYSMEMTSTQLTARLTSMVSRIPSSSILYKKLCTTDLEYVANAIPQLPLDNIFFDDKSTSNVDNIIASIRYIKIRHGISGAVVDYLQILSVNMRGESSKEQLYAEAARRLKNLAKELDIWIVALSQLSRNLDSPVPSLDRLRGSGQIAEAADTVLLVYRPETYNKTYPSPFESVNTHNTAMIDIAKGRNTGIGKFICNFIPELTMFSEADVTISDNNENSNVPF